MMECVAKLALAFFFFFFFFIKRKEKDVLVEFYLVPCTCSRASEAGDSCLCCCVRVRSFDS